MFSYPILISRDDDASLSSEQVSEWLLYCMPYYYQAVFMTMCFFSLVAILWECISEIIIVNKILDFEVLRT